MTGAESYGEDILKGDLRDWFKPIYIQNHAIWLNNNFEKQEGLRKLNEMKLRDETINAFSSN